MDFFRNVAKNVRGFFTSVFDNDDEDEKRRRRQQQQRQQQQRQRQAPSQAQRFRDNVSAGTLTAPNHSPRAQQKQQPKELQNTLSEQFRKLQTQPPEPPKVPKPPLVLSPDAVRREKARQQSELITTGRVTPRIQGVVLTPEEFNQAARRRAAMNKRQTPKLDAAREVFAAPGKVAGAIAQGLARIPETIVRSGAEKLSETITGEDFSYSQRGKNTGIRRLLYGEESVDTYQKQGDDIAKALRDVTNSRVDLPAPLVGVALAALDIGGVGVVSSARSVSRELAKESAEAGLGSIGRPIVRSIEEGGARSKEAIDRAIDAVRKRVEQGMGRKLTPDEAADLSKRTEATVKKELDQAKKTPANDQTPTDTPKPSSQSPTQPRTREEVETSYKNIVNTINNDPNLTPDQKAQYLEAAKTQHANMLRQIDEGAKAGDEVVQEATEQAQRQQDELAETVEQVQTQQRAAAAPEPEELGRGAPVRDPDDPLDAEVNANNAYGADVEGDTLTSEDLSDVVATHRARFGDENVEIGNTGDAAVRGEYTYQDDMVRLAEGRATDETLNHEHVHKAIGQFLEDAEIEQLYRDIVKVRGGKKSLTEKYRERGYEDANWRDAAEEEIANEFNTFLKYRQTFKTSDNIADKMADFAISRNLPQSIVQLFMRLSDSINATFGRNAAAGRMDDFYKRIVNEEFASPDAPRRTSQYQQPLPFGTRLRNAAADAAVQATTRPIPFVSNRLQDRALDKALDIRYGRASRTGDSKQSRERMDAEVDANNTYDDDISREIGSRRAQIDSIREAQTTPPIQSAWHWLRRNLADPLGTTQAQAGTQVADETMRIANADAATRAMLRDDGIRDIIAKYGESTGRVQNFFNPGRNQLARDFEDYRIFRDELWRMNDEGREVSSILDSNGNPLDPSVMARFVRQMDETNPEFAEDAAKLREFSLENMRTRTNMGADSREMYESSARNPFYTPRQQATPDDRVAPEIGGIHNRVATTTQGRGDAAYNVTSPMDLFVNDARNTIRGDAAQRRAQMLIDQGMNVSQDAGAAAIRRDAMRDMQSIATRRRELQDALKSARGDRKVIRAELKGLEDRAVERMRNYFVEQATDAAGKKAARTMSREELVDVFNLATEAGEVPGKTISKSMQTRVLKEAELDKAVQGLKADIKASRQDSTDAYQEMMDNIEFNPKTGMATVSYKVDGAVGKIEIPAEWAREWSQLDKQFNRSPVGKALDAFGNVFKVTWTGTLAPMFQLKQIIMNTGLMFRNAEGLSGIDHRAFSGFIRGLIRNEKLGGNDAQRRMFEQYGAQFETATQGVILRRNIADDIVNHAGIGEYLLKNPVRTLGDLANAINRTLAHVSNAQRMAVINGAYHRGLRQGMNEEQAMRHAAMASAKVFGDFNRVSQLARNLEAVLPYSGAMQSGARAIYQASKTRPLETTTKDAVILSSLAGIVAWNYQMGAGDYYKAMADDNADYEVENNIAIATGEVTQNEDGTWNNLIKIPLTPDFRPVQRGVVQSYIDMENGEGIDPAFLGMQLFNFFTGDVSDSLWNEDRSRNPGANPLIDSVLPQSPVINIGRIIADRDTWGGGSNIDDRMRERPRADQAYDSTSNAARQLSDLTGNLFTPIQADQMLRQFGSAGQSLRDVDTDTGLRDALSERMFNFGKIFEPRKVETDDDKIATRQYYQNIDQILHDAAAEGYDDATRAAFKALHSKKGDRSKDNLLNSAVKAAQFMEYSGDGSFSSSQLFDLEKRLDTMAREQGRPGNPLFDLAPQELQRVLMYRSMKAPNAAKQNYSKGGEAAFTALGLDEPWYQQFRDAESDYYKAIFGDNEDDEDSSTYRTFSGEKKPQLTDEQRALQDQYFALDKASRREFLAANPWLKDYWAESNEFTDQERKALGFSSSDGDSVYDGNSGSGYGRGRGRGGGRSPREDRPNTENVLNSLTNEAGTLKRLESLVGKEQAPQLMAQLKRLFASQRGGRANVPIGARSKGQN